jgi:Cdc6-like AAA superfamily ATPase
MPRDMASVAIEGNTVENSPYTNIISTESINFYVFCNVPHDEDTDTKDSLYWTSLQAWFAVEDRTAQSRDSSLPDLFASSLTNWVLRDAAFHACSLQKGQTVLLRGGMGVGKTTTMCGLIKHLHDCGTVAVAFMLADSDRKSEHSPRKILMLFVQPLSNDNRKQRKHAWKLVNKNLTGRPSAHEARGTLVSIIKSHYDMKKRRTTCLLLDGLDEFEDDDLQELLCHLAEVQQLTSCGIILASRVDNLNTKKWFKKLEPLEIMAHSADIKYYVDKAYRGSAVDGLDRQHRGKIASISEAVAAGSCGS